jgi:hypothetical protein
MATKKNKKEIKAKAKIRDLKPRKDAKGGGGHPLGGTPTGGSLGTGLGGSLGGSH